MRLTLINIGCLEYRGDRGRAIRVTIILTPGQALNSDERTLPDAQPWREFRGSAQDSNAVYRASSALWDVDAWTAFDSLPSEGFFVPGGDHQR